MRRLTPMVVVVAVLAGLMAPAVAQVQVMIGPRVGLNIANISLEEDGISTEGLDSKLGIHAGAQLTFGLSPLFGISTGGYFSQKGSSDSEGGVETTLAANYLSVPLTAVVTVPTGPNSVVRPHFFAGGIVSFEMTCNIKGEAGGVSASVSCSDAGIETESLDFGALFGGGIGFQIGPGTLSVDAAYELGLRDLDKDATTKVKSKVVYISTAFMIPIGGPPQP